MIKSGYVIDASVILAWFETGEHLSGKRIYAQFLGKGTNFYAPEFLLIEASNVLLRKKHFSLQEVNDVYEQLVSSGILFHPLPFVDIKKVIELAAEFSITTYDAHYVFLAQKYGFKLITADDQLLKLLFAVKLKDIPEISAEIH